MKKLLPILISIGLAIVVLVQYLQLQRLSPAEDYSYTLREDIDLDYHNPTVVGAYYHAARQVGAFARQMWYSEDINVRLVDSDDPEEVAAGQYYVGLLAYADSLGARLARSARLKSKGYTNADIQQMEQGNFAPAQKQVQEIFGVPRLARGDRNEAVWVLQDLLIVRGHEIPHDGNFGDETRTAVRLFQERQKLLPTGVADSKTLAVLIEQSTQKP